MQSFIHVTESTNAQDKRIEELYKALDVKQKGAIDLRDLKAGLQKIDHPLRNAGPLLEDVLDHMDANHDGKITYEEFYTFVKHTESQLRNFFRQIDRNGDGKLEKSELQSAFRRAGLTVSNRKLEDFFSHVDTNNDGVVTFEEWRDFLLFLPSSANLESVLSYYSTTLRVGPEGDVLVTDETKQGLGTIGSFLYPFFASLFLVIPQRTPAGTSPSMEDDRSGAGSSGLLASPVTAAEPVLLPRVDWSHWEDIEPILIACVPSTGYFVAGGVAGAVSRTATAPLDRLKVYFIAQTKKPGTVSGAGSSLAIGSATVSFYRTVVNAMKELWVAGGMRSLYAGNGLNIIKVMPESSIRFGFFEACRRVTARLEGHNNPKQISFLSTMVCGGVGGSAAQFAVYPLDTLKFRMQCETVSGGLHGNRLIIATAKKMWQSGGIKSYYKGLAAGIIGVFPYSAIDLGTFNLLKTTVTQRTAAKYGLHEEDAQPSPGVTAAMGGFSGALGATLVYPVNLCRTRLQSQGTVLHPPTYDGFWDVARRTVQNEGTKGLFKGLAPNLVKVIPAVSITYVVYEQFKRNWELN